MVDNFNFIDEFIAGSAYPNTPDDIDEYLELGITDVFSLTPNLPLVSKYVGDRGIKFHHLPVYATPDKSQLEEFIARVLVIREDGGKAVVHCQYGQERTGIFIATYLMKLKGMSLNDAIRKVRVTRPGSLQTHHAVTFLKKNLT